MQFWGAFTHPVIHIMLHFGSNAAHLYIHEPCPKLIMFLFSQIFENHVGNQSQPWNVKENHKFFDQNHPNFEFFFLKID